MPDIHKNEIGHRKYRYSINELIELSATAHVPFDLSKFTYDAARAGVIPSLGDCAVASRKSSAVSGRRHEIETVAVDEVVAVQGNTRPGPGREPYLPPPMERQKDEGFVKFLRKHSSPTHNRVTAGGRIVPMEPRSPPPFTLPFNAGGTSQNFTDDEGLLNAQQNGKTGWPNKVRNGLEYNITGTNPLFDSSPVHLAEFQGEASVNTYEVPSFHRAPVCNSPPNVRPNPNAPNLLLPPISFTHSYGSMQEPVGVVMPPASYNSQFGSNNYAPYYDTTPSAGVAYGGDPVAAPVWEMYSQLLGHQMYDFQTPTAQQQLASWQQHYADLDLQLKNIDRHRAMHQLDPYLAEQRRVIVQQRSDAKDTIREYQGMLGLKRMTDSSQESFMTGFNVDAPAYIPAIGYSKTGAFASRDPTSNAPKEQTISVTQSSSGRKAIPIRPPPSSENSKVNNFTTKPTDSERRGMVCVENRNCQKQNTSHNVKEEQMMSPSISNHNTSVYQQRSDNHALVKDDVGMYENWSVPERGKGRLSKETSRIVIPKTENGKIAPASPALPINPGHELQQIVDAISRPKGVITQIRLLANRVIDVEGQDLQLDASPLPDGTWTHSHEAGQGSMQPGLQHNRDVPPKPGSSSDGGAFVDEIANKENISVTPMFRQKAATDAFLSQFNVIDDSIALAIKSETQSLRPVSNCQDRQSEGHGYKVQDFYQPQASVRMNSTQVQSIQGSDQKQNAIDRGNNENTITAGPLSTEDFNHKGYSSVGIQNIHAVGRLPHNFDGSVDTQQNAQARLSNAKKARSPRFLRRHGINGGA